MIRTAFASILLACAAPAGAQALSTPEDRIRADVTFLADDLLEGRGNGSKGYEIASRYLATRFASLGLKPGNGSSYFQPITFVRTELDRSRPNYLTIGGKRFDNASDILFSASTLEAATDVSADTVFVGYGLDAPDYGFNDYAGIDVRGKFVVVLWGFPPGTPTEMASHLNSEKALMAQRHGAIGLITVNTPRREEVSPWDMARKYAKRPNFTWVGKDGQPYSVAPKLRATASMNLKAAAELFAGAPRSLDQLVADSAKPGVKPGGFALKPKIRLVRHSKLTRVTSPNVIAILPGSDPKLAGEYIMLGGHLDAIGITDAVDGDTIVNGAMDNASGIATLLEVARTFVQSGERPKRSLIFAGFAAEENGLLGSSYLAKNPVTPPGKLAGVVNLDMPILTYDFTDVIAYGADHSTIARTVATAIASEKLKLVPDPEPDQNYFVRSDHYNFVKQGVPAVALDTGPGNGGDKAGEAFVKNNYHKPSDDLKLAWNWGSAAKFARMNYLVARGLADAPEPPRWYEGDFFGDVFAKDAQKAKR